MADDFISDNTYKAGVLGLISAGLGLITYHTFFKKRSYLVEYAFTVKGRDEVTVPGTVAFDERVLNVKNHEDLFNYVMKHVKSTQSLHEEQEVDLQISHIHVM
jgi:hypothetical protein